MPDPKQVQNLTTLPLITDEMVKNAVSVSGFKCYQPTENFRILRPKPTIITLTTPQPDRLQQEWREPITGEKMWKDVPIVFEDDENAS